MQNSPLKFEVEDEERPRLLQILTFNRIAIVEEKMNWMDSIYLAGEPLIRAGSILEKYLDAIISQTMYYGPYMFLNDAIMLAHAKPQDGVNRLDLSLTIFKQPIEFSGSRAAKMIIMLCAEDNERHLGIMNDILKMCGDERTIERLISADEPDYILDKLQSILN